MSCSFFPPPKGKTFFYFLANGCRVSPSRSSGQQARRDRQQHVQHTTTTSYIYADVVLLDFNRARDCLNARAPLSSNTKPTVVPSHMHRSNKVHSNIDRPIDFPPTPIEEEGWQHFLAFFFWPGCDGVSVKVKNPPKSWFFLFFLFFQTTTISGWTVTVKVDTTQLPALRVQTSCPARNPPPSAKKQQKMCVCLNILWKLFFKKVPCGWWVRFHNGAFRAVSYNESIYITQQHPSSIRIQSTVLICRSPVIFTFANDHRRMAENIKMKIYAPMFPWRASRRGLGQNKI